MSDETTTQVNETPAAAPSEDALNRLKTELRDAGEAGKKQWQDAFAKTRDAVQAGSERATKLAGRTREAVEQVYARAEQRGADLLLRLVSSVRAGAESFEASLRDRARPKAAPAAEPAPASA